MGDKLVCDKCGVRKDERAYPPHLLASGDQMCRQCYSKVQAVHSTLARSKRVKRKCLRCEKVFTSLEDMRLCTPCKTTINYIDPPTEYTIIK